MPGRILDRWARETAEPYGGKLTRLNLQMPLSLKQALDSLAEADGVSLPELARRMLADKLREMESDRLGRVALEKYPATLETRRKIEARWREIDEESEKGLPQRKRRGARPAR